MSEVRLTGREVRLTGSQVKRLRGALGLTQEELATRSLVSRQTLALFESEADRLMPDSRPGRAIVSVLLDSPVVEVTEDGTVRVAII